MKYLIILIVLLSTISSQARYEDFISYKGNKVLNIEACNEANELSAKFAYENTMLRKKLKFFTYILSLKIREDMGQALNDKIYETLKDDLNEYGDNE